MSTHLSLSPQDVSRSSTASGMPWLLGALQPLRDVEIQSVLDVGCGFGGVSRLVGETLGAERIHGVDIDEGVIPEAVAKGVAAQRLDIEVDALPYDAGAFDFVMSLGMLDYLPMFDHALEEIHRVLRPGGYVLISLPNLGSWHNRLALMAGFQPRDVELSERRVVGVLPRYRSDPPTGHLHVPTLRAFRELMDVHGFSEVRVSSGAWHTKGASRAVTFIDRAFALRPSLARRFFYLGRKNDDAAAQANASWWRGRSQVRVPT